MSAKGKLLACCGVIPNTEALIIDDDYRPENLAKAIERSQQSPLLNWLFLRGPYSIIEFIGGAFSTQVPERESIGGNCEACKILFETAEISNHLESAVSLKAAEIAGELGVLAALELTSPKDVMTLWADTSLVDTRHPA